jgi:hypothetical protein
VFDGVDSDNDSDDNNLNVCMDSDADTCDDCSTGTFDPANDGSDQDADGLCDAGDDDDDNDGCLDGEGVPDACGVCGGDGSSCTGSNSVDVTYDFEVDVYGFQFSVSGATIVSASGGAAADASFTVSNGDDTVLGFSITGGYIPAGSGILTTLETSGDAAGLCIDVSSLVLSDGAGAGIDGAAVGCTGVETSGGTTDVAGCMDATACNHHPW